MAEHLSLIEFIRRLLGDADLREQFTNNPQKALDSVGLGQIDAHDVRDALTLVRDDSPGPEHHGNGHHGNGHAPQPHHHESAASYVDRYIHNEFVDHRTTHIDHSFHQDVDTDGGDFDQELDYHPTAATGDGAVAAGRDISGSTVTTGDGNDVGNGNVRGDGNVVGSGNHAATGHGNTVGFGEGAVNSTKVGGDVKVGDHAAFSSGGSATSTYTDSSNTGSFNHHTDASINDSYNDHSHHSISDSYNTDTDNHSDHSHNTDVDTDIKDSFNGEHPHAAALGPVGFENT